MAREARQQRRARREQQAEVAAPKPARRQVRPTADEEPRVQTGGRGRFVAESWAELRKVEWPGQQQLIQGTVVVLIACAIVGTYLWGADLVFKRLVQDVFLR